MRFPCVVGFSILIFLGSLLAGAGSSVNAQDSLENSAKTGAASSLPGTSSIQAQFMRGALAVLSGSRFSIALLQPLDSRTLKIGEPVQGMLIEPIEVGELKIAAAGATVKGWVSSIHERRNSMQARLSSRNWLNSSATLSLHFSEIIDGERHYQISAAPASGTEVYSTNSNLHQKVDKEGNLLVEFHGAKYILAGAGISAASMLAGPAGLIVAPAASGTLAALVPEYALDHPLQNDSTQTRARATLTGAVKGLPGGFLISGLVNKGLPVTVPAGETLTLELKNDLVIGTRISTKAGTLIQ